MTQLLIDRATLEKALKLAFNLGQTYWQQADSDYVSQQNKSDGTREKFNQLITDTCAALANAEPADTDDALMREALYALEYAADMTKPEGLSGCDCPICTSTIALQKRLGEKI